METHWIEVYYDGTGWSNTTVYVNPLFEQAKVCRFRVTHWGYHDECDSEESEEIISIEEALNLVFPDYKAVTEILRHTRRDYSAVLRKISEKHFR